MSLSTDKGLEVNNEIPSLSILVVDDDELNRRLMSILLTREGHRVEVASNGFEAIDAVKAQKFLVLMEFVVLPKKWDSMPTISAF